MADTFPNQLIIIGTISTFIVPYLFILCYKDFCQKNNIDFDVNKKPIKYTLISVISWLVLYAIICITFIGLPNKPNKRPKNYYQKREKSSIDYVIEERAKKPFNNTIFAGIRFGDSPQIVEQKLKEYKQTYGNVIYADSSSYNIYDIRVYYYKEKLQTLKINFGSIWTDFDDLWELFEKKYGKTHFNDWEFQDVIIDYSEQTDAKQLWDTKGYNDTKYYIYNNDYKTITDTPSYYSIITYSSKTIAAEEKEDKEKEKLKAKEEQLRKDSIRKANDFAKKKQAKEISTTSNIPI